MSIGANIRYLVTVQSGGEIRDFGAAMERSGGDVEVLAWKGRRGAGETEVVKTGLPSTGNVTLEFDQDRFQSNKAWMDAALQRSDATATLTVQKLRGNVPVETLDVVAAVPVGYGGLESEADGDDNTTRSIEFMIGDRA